MRRGAPYSEWTEEERAHHRASKRALADRRRRERDLESAIITEMPPLGRWAKRGECAKRNLPSEMFHPPTDRDIPPAALLAEQRRAAHACGACPVRRECLTEARDNRFLGIWGGMLRTQGHRREDRDSELDLVAMHRAGHLTRPAHRRTHPKPAITEGIAA